MANGQTETMDMRIVPNDLEPVDDATVKSQKDSVAETIGFIAYMTKCGKDGTSYSEIIDGIKSNFPGIYESRKEDFDVMKALYEQGKSGALHEAGLDGEEDTVEATEPEDDSISADEASLTEEEPAAEKISKPVEVGEMKHPVKPKENENTITIGTEDGDSITIDAPEGSDIEISHDEDGDLHVKVGDEKKLMPGEMPTRTKDDPEAVPGDTKTISPQPMGPLADEIPMRSFEGEPEYFSDTETDDMSYDPDSILPDGFDPDTDMEVWANLDEPDYGNTAPAEAVSDGKSSGQRTPLSVWLEGTMNKSKSKSKDMDYGAMAESTLSDSLPKDVLEKASDGLDFDV